VTSVAEVTDEGEYLFKDISHKFQATHYHSWAVLPETINGDLQITAKNNEGLVMGLRHKKFDVRGLQFHPESVMTPEGPKMIENWLRK
jgi:anthranilate synthase component 2